MPSGSFLSSLRVPVSSVRFADTAYKSSIPTLNSDASHDRASGRVMHRYCFISPSFLLDVCAHHFSLYAKGIVRLKEMVVFLWKGFYGIAI